MTSELCVMNRHAVVLAADSATTVTGWVDGEREERYFKGANKIFQLSNHHPVGMMIFDSADILKVPWEIVAKQFRTELGSRSFNDLVSYASEFFTFLESQPRLFPPSVQKETFVDAARGAGLQLVIGVEAPPPGGATMQAAVDQACLERRQLISEQPLSPCLNEDLVRETTVSWLDDVAGSFDDWKALIDRPLPSDLKAFAELCILDVFKNHREHLGTTGMVFAGFGDHNIFPEMIEYTSSGLVAGKHVATRESDATIDHETPALLSAFAQTSMSDTFALGFSRDVYGLMMQSVTEGLNAFVDEVAQASGGDAGQIGNRTEMIAAARKRISDSAFERAREKHAYPLRRVLGFLPIDEMAELAETLINLQSLKEKVTKPSATVGGPIDVAVITRNEGFIWIKRKHFFDAALNPRYAHRQSALYR